MIVYLMGCLSSVLIAYLGTHIPKARKYRAGVIFFSALPLLLIAALRHDVGEDYFYTYVPYFEVVRAGADTEATRLEPLYHLINEVVVFLGGDYEWVFVISAVLFLFAVYAQIFQDSPLPALSIFCLMAMGYYFVFFNAMRQMIGCGILLYSMRYIQRKRLLPFLLCVAAASCFHDSCIVFVVMYWAGRIRIRPVIAWIMTVLVAVLSDVIARLLRQIIALTQYSNYFMSVFDTGEPAYVTMAINAVLLLVASLCYRDAPRYRLYYNTQIIALWITFFTGKVVLFMRILWPFGLPSVIMVPMMLYSIENIKNRKLIMSTVVLMYFLYTLYTVGVQNSNTVLPYQTIFGRWGL